MAGILHTIISPIGGSSGLLIAVDVANLNVRDMLLANGWDGVSIINPVVTIGANAKVYSTSTSIPAFDTGVLPVGSTVTINNTGAILGKGGSGGGASGPVQPGFAGGTGLKVRVPTTIVNLGAIGGGGGGGGQGGTTSGGSALRSGGGGAGGAGNGAGVRGTGFSIPGTTGGNGTLTAPGYGTSAPGYTAGGNGGFYGQAGGTGQTGITELPTPGAAGGAAGLAVDGDSLVTWTTLGTIYGARSG